MGTKIVLSLIVAVVGIALMTASPQSRARTANDRLGWLIRDKVAVLHVGRGWRADWAWGSTHRAYGATENEAVVNLCVLGK